MIVSLENNFSAFSQSSAAATITNGTWHHLAYVFNAGQWNFYFDGVLLGTANVADGEALVAAPNYNAFGTVNYNFGAPISPPAAISAPDFKMDEVRLWNTARSGTEIANNRNIELSGSEANLIGYWKLNETTGQTVADSEPPGTTPTLNGFLGDNNSDAVNDPTINTTGIVTAGSSNTAPTGTDFTANPSENLLYTFSTGDFGYNDGDGDALNTIRIDAIPATATLFLDVNDNNTIDALEPVTNGDLISKANLDAGRLKYLQNGSTNTSFTFSVNDGTDFSASSNTATLTMLAIPSVTLSVSPTSRIESIPTAANITATLSNTYGAAVTVNLGFSGTATGG
ncbi:MAG: LamG-like jellyroll fold domain-containing protein, partial [Bacteroidota bacterium]